MLSSFVPSTGRLLHVKIYPSEFGKAEIAKENAVGPSIKVGSSGDEFDQVALRKWAGCCAAVP